MILKLGSAFVSVLPYQLIGHEQAGDNAGLLLVNVKKSQEMAAAKAGMDRTRDLR